MMSRFTSARSLNMARHGWGLFKNKRTMWQMVREALSGKYRMSLFTTLALLFGLAYIIFPFDLIPDWIPIVGWIDDGVVVYLVIRRLNTETMRYSRYKAMERKNTDAGSIRIL